MDTGNILSHFKHIVLLQRIINKNMFKHRTYYIKIKFSGDRNMSSKRNRNEVKVLTTNKILFI